MTERLPSTVMIAVSGLIFTDNQSPLDLKLDQD
jgi:hypothetical protein